MLTKKIQLPFICAMMALTFSAATVSGETASDERKEVYLSIDSDALQFSEKTFGKRVEEVETKEGISVIKIDEDSIPWLSMLMHRNFNRCGGFMLHDDEADALAILDSQDGSQKFAKNHIFTSYVVNQENLILPMIAGVNESNILAEITKLSSYKNRYYKGPFGKESAAYIKTTWEKLVASRSDAKVEYYEHAKWDQPSIILTFKGQSDEVVIVGGHQDSISGSWGGASATAPGADDNASGIATMTEVIRVLVENSYAPEKTIKFIAYAAEEVGLLGSKEISTNFKKENVNVIGVMQLDMTNFKGTKELDIVLMRDYTNDEQNNFIGSLLDKYLPEVKWGFDKCGYGCSDHASWHAQGYPASMPFEAKKRDMNGNIHTGRDTVATMGNSAAHAAKFAKMALSYIVELDR